MRALLSIEWLKLRRYRTFKIIFILFAGLLLLWNYAMNQGIMTFGASASIFNLAYSFPEVWGNLGFWVKFFTSMLSVVMIIVTTNEYQYRTNRQNVIDGWSRMNFYHAKWMLLLTMAFAITVFTGVVGLIFGLANGSPISAATGDIKYLLFVFLLVVNYFGFAFILSLLIKRSGLTIILFLLYGYIGEILIQQLINWKIAGKPGNFLPMQCSAELLPFPILKMIGKMTKATPGPAEIWLCVASVFWILVYYFIGRRKLLRSDW